jgi:hypothetical protein
MNDKSITILGTANKYQLKKMQKEKDKEKHVSKRVVCNKWFIQPELLTHAVQLQIIDGAYINSDYINSDYINSAYINSANDGFGNYFEKYLLFKQQIDNKIYSYGQQDMKKHLFNDGAFINFTGALQLLRDSKLTCVYCSENVFVLYENVREPLQWSLDRIDNDLGHNCGNLLIACLKCNLKRRRTNMNSFLFTKQMKLVKTC